MPSQLRRVSRNSQTAGAITTVSGLNLKSMSASDLLDLRSRVDAILSAKVRSERSLLETALKKLDGFSGGARWGRPAKLHALAGKKVAPKYRGPNGETWTGRGMKPRWLAEAIRGGKAPDDFLIVVGGKRAGKAGRKAKAS